VTDKTDIIQAFGHGAQICITCLLLKSSASPFLSRNTS